MENSLFEKRVLRIASINARKIIQKVEQYLDNPTKNIDKIVNELSIDINPTNISWINKAKIKPIISELYKAYLKGNNLTLALEDISDDRLSNTINLIPPFFPPLEEDAHTKEIEQNEQYKRREYLVEVRKQIIEDLEDLVVFDKTIDKVLNILESHFKGDSLLLSKAKNYLLGDEATGRVIDTLEIVFADNLGLSIFKSVEEGFAEESIAPNFNDYSAMYTKFFKWGLLRGKIPQILLIDYIESKGLLTNESQFRRNRTPSSTLKTILKRACEKHNFGYY